MPAAGYWSRSCSGGTSVVYRAEHVRLGRPAALKLLTPALGEADFRGRFLRESQLAASLDHPSIVPVYDAGEVDGLLYIAMACVEGSDLKSLLAEEDRLPLRRALRVIAQIGRRSTPLTPADSSTATSSRRTSSSRPTIARISPISAS